MSRPRGTASAAAAPAVPPATHAGLPPWLGCRPDGTWTIRVHAQPGAARSEVVGVHGDALKVRVAAPPVEGRANAELIACLASCLALGRRAIALQRGATGRAKVFEVSAPALSATEVVARLTRPA